MAMIADDLPPEDRDGSAGRDDMSPIGGEMSWCWDFDFDALLDAVSGAAPWRRAPQAGAADSGVADSAHPKAEEAAVEAGDLDPEADEAEYQEALAAGRVQEMPLAVVAGRVAESLPTGPGLAGWLAQAPAPDLEDGALAGVAASFRRLASWAAAGELAAVAQIASRSARADRRATVDGSGRPDRVTTDAAGQISLALAMSHDGASGWTDLAVTLTWRLPATGAALAAGEIDLARARMIARMTGPLSDDAARQVESAVLGRAGWFTLGQLHAALRCAVIKADPQGAERRRREAERNAKVVLYPEDEGTAALAGYALPGVQAAAAMARITALAKAMQAAGNGGRIDLVRAQVFLGLLLGTLPYIPPAPGAAPDEPPPDNAGPGEPADGASPGEPANDSRPDDPAGCAAPVDGPLPDDQPVPELPADDSPGDAGASGEPAGKCSAGFAAGADELVWPWPGVLPSLLPAPGTLAGVRPLPAAGGLLGLTVPLGTLIGTSSAPGHVSRLGVITPGQARQLADLAARHRTTRWRIVVVTPEGEAIAVTHLPRSRSPDTAGDGHGGIGLIGRVTLVIRTDQLAPAPDHCAHGPPGHGSPARGSPLAKIAERAIAAAGRAAAVAAGKRREDARSGGCGHQLASTAYRPPPRIAELVIARDGTCRFGPCRRPAEQCDLDHVRPYDQGGLTCSCNLGGDCRLHHQLKQHRGWSVTQPVPGIFRWTTPAGRTYITRPDLYLT